MKREERYYHECPECGLLTPWIQGRCDCGYKFRKKFTRDHSFAVIACVLSALLAFSAGYTAKFLNSYPVPTSEPTPLSGLSGTKVNSGRQIYTYATPSTLVPSPTLTPRVSATPSLPPAVPVVSGEIIKAPLDDGVAPFTAETSAGKNYYIYLKYLSPGDSSAWLSLRNSVSFYVEGGKTEKVYVPLGEYKVYYATGNTWYGPSDKFGSSTRTYLCDGTFIFSANGDYYEGWSVTLYPVYDGNMDTDEIPLDEFPE